MHDKKIEDVLRELGTSKQGLSEEESKNRLLKYGPNELAYGKKIPPIKIFFSQFKSIVIWILIGATVISAFLGENIDAIVILVVLILIGVIGFIQEYRAENAIDALRKLASLKATVIRDNQKKETDSKEIVVGDVLVLETGDKIPSDARIIESYNLETQEAALTGESLPVKKHSAALSSKIVVADRKNMVFSGTIVTSGRATAVVTATAMNTEIGKIATLIQQEEYELTPLQRNMNSLGKWLGYATIIICAIVFVAGIAFLKISSLKMFIVAVSLAVAVIPEALPMVVVVSLALGTQRMLKRNVLIRRLPSVETLGSTTVICTDKTGTLTMNEMTVRKAFVNGMVIDVSGAGYETKGEFTCKGKKTADAELRFLLRIGALTNDANLKDGKIIGDPTEGALIVSAAKLGLIKEELEIEYPRIDEMSFTSERKMMTTVHKHHGEKLAYSKGAPDVILKKCNYIWVNGKAKKLSKEMHREILEVNKEFAKNALRVLGFAYKTVIDTQPEKNMIFVGLQAMIDPPREEVKGAIEKCKKAGIRVIMITGDHEITARAVAKELGLEGKSLTGEQVEDMENLDNVVDEVAIFARVNPEHKLKIVDALKKKGHIVAMTGDGVNDAPALKKADIGIAMGITGTDVAKEASSMILLDDNFTSIVNAVEEGRGVYDNIKKYFAFLVSGNIGKVLVIFVTILIVPLIGISSSEIPLPLTATQILIINLLTDGLPALALAVDPFEPGVMNRKPRRHNEPIYKGLSPFLIYYSMVKFLLGIGIFSYIYITEKNLLKAQTMTFLMIIISQLYLAFSTRSIRYSVFKVGMFKNGWLVVAVAVSLAVTLSAVFMPVLHKLFNTTPISVFELLFIVAISSLGAIAVEISKYINIKKEASQSAQSAD